MTIWMKVRDFNPFVGLMDDIDYVTIKFLMDFDFGNVSSCREMYDVWRKTRHFPERFQEANKLLAEVEQICPIANFAQGFSKNEGSYIILLIGKEVAKKKEVVSKLRKLIEMF